MTNEKPRRRANKKLAAPQTPLEVVLERESQCSIELSRDAKGTARWSIKLYGELDNLDHLVDEAHRIDDILRDHEQEDEEDDAE